MGPLFYVTQNYVIIFFILFGYGVVELQASHHVYRNLQATVDAVARPPDHQPYRTAYHFQPPKNWINDPNAPMLYKGIYHLFYQYNPNGVVWGPPVWAHSTSTDLINWTPQPVAIFPSIPSDIGGCWSGSATFLPGNRPAILYTGVTATKEQVQNLAVPKDLSDPYLKEWVKVPQNPLMAPSPTNQINGSSYRDPTTAWSLPDGRWRVIVGNKRETRGRALLYRSRDFVSWVESKHALHTTLGTGMWECPDFFPVDVKGALGLHTNAIGPNFKHVLKVSLDDTKHDVYTIGTYNVKKDAYTPDPGFTQNDSSLRYDYGKMYASKTFFDEAKRRRILLAWINESSSVADDAEKGWSGIHSIPRNIWLDKSGKQLIQWPIEELDSLRQKRVVLPNMALKAGSKREVFGITAAQADVEVTFRVPDFSKAEKLGQNWANPQMICSQMGLKAQGGIGPFGLLTLASRGMEEYTAVIFRIFKGINDKLLVLMCSDQSRSSLNPTNDKTTYGTFVEVDPLHEELSLRTLIDHSIVESFGANGKSCITARVYPTIAIDNQAHLYVFNNGSTPVQLTGLSAWSMKKAHIN